MAEYWIVDWRTRTIEICRHDGTALSPVATLSADATLTLSLLPGFTAPLPRIFAALP